MASVMMGPAFQLADRAATRQRGAQTASYTLRTTKDGRGWWRLLGGCIGHPETEIERGRWPQVLAFYACELAQLDEPWGVERDEAVYACSGMYSEAAYEWALGQLCLTDEEPVCRDLWRTEQWTAIHKDTGNLTWSESMLARHLELFVADEGDQCDSCGASMADGHLFWGDTFRSARWRYCCSGCASTGVTGASRKARFIAHVLD